MLKRRKLLISILLVTNQLLSTQAVVSPLEKVTEELKEMQETVSSVQASLIASVSLIQDQLVEFTEKTSKIINTKLSNLEHQVERINTNIMRINEKTEALDAVEPDMKGWSEKVSDLEEKMNDLKKSQETGMFKLQEKIDIIPQVDFNLEKLNQKVSKIDKQLNLMDTRMIMLQDSFKESSKQGTEIYTEAFLTKLNKIESGLNNTLGHSRRPYKRNHSRNSGHRRNDATGTQVCQANQKILINLDKIVQSIWQTVKTQDMMEKGSPRFEYLRSDERSDKKEYKNVKEDHYGKEDRVTHLQKLSIPFKRMSKRLTEIKSEVQTGNDDIERQLADLRSMASEKSYEQNVLIQGYSKDFASISQCCSAHSDDFNRFVAHTGPVMDRIDQWITSWQNMASQKFERILQQNNYDHDTITKGQKEIERLLVEGFDRCKSASREAIKKTLYVQRETNKEDIISEFETDTVTQIPTDSQLSDEPAATTSFTQGCGNPKLVRTSVAKVYRTGDSQLNEAGRDFNIRYCDQKTGGGGWTVIQRRGDYGDPKENFTRDWNDYKYGFGDLNGEFWFGNDYISQLTLHTPFTLRVELEAHDGRTAWAEYDTFRVEGEAMDYRVWVGGYSGNASDSLSAHNGYKFSTVDRNNDQAPKCCPCAPAYGGGWWFYSCFEANLNGEYFSVNTDNGYYRGIIWELWLGDNSLKSAQMMIRPVDFHVGFGLDNRHP